MSRKLIRTEPGSTDERELITLTLASSLENMLSFIEGAGFVGWATWYQDRGQQITSSILGLLILQKKDNSLSKEPPKCCQLSVRRK